MTLLSRLTRLTLPFVAWRSRRRAGAASPPGSKASCPPREGMSGVPDPITLSRRAWLKPGLAGAASLAFLPAAVRAASPNGAIQDYGLSVDDFGAKGDGMTDDAPALQAAINALGAAGGRILLGARHYRLASPVIITRAYVTIQGQGYAEAPAPSGGTWLIITTSGFQPITVTNNTPGGETRGTTFRDLAVWQPQPPLRSGWAPTDYPFVFMLDQMAGGVEFDNLYLCNVTRGIHAHLVGRLNIGYLKGQCYDTMVFIEEAYDTCRIEYIESWFFVTHDINVSAYMLDYYDPLRLGRVDGIYINNMFVFCARAGIHCIQQTAGTAQFMLGTFGCDHARYGIWFDRCVYDQNGTFFSTINQIVSNHVRWQPEGGGGTPIPGGCQIMMQACTRLSLQINMTSCGFVDGSIIQVSGSENRLFIGMALFSQFNRGQHTPPAPAFYLMDSGPARPNLVQMSQPAVIDNSSGGSVFATDGNGLYREPQTLLEAHGAGLPRAAAPSGISQPHLQDGVVHHG